MTADQDVAAETYPHRHRDVAGGRVVSRLIIRPFWYGALRQLLLGTAAAAVPFFIGYLVGAIV
jgi:ABC-type dipeptide/oligopeptide/nickel transport system permease subunit